MTAPISRADIVSAASFIGAPLTDEQRIALGVTLIEMAREPASFGAVRHAERIVAGHARMLLSDALREDEAPFEQVAGVPLMDRTAPVTPADRGTAGTPRPRLSSSLRAAWATFLAAERRFSESLWGDLLAGACAVALAVAIPFIVWGLQ